MKSKHDVKYLIATIALLTVTSTTLSATEVMNTNEIFTESAVVETLQPIKVIEDSDKVDIPVLVKPEVITETNDEIKVEELSITADIDPSVPREPMPIPENKTNQYIPLLDDAIIFANFDDVLPAVANFYTQASEQEIINFYQLNLGEVISEERKRGQLTLTFKSADLTKRVVISEQNNKHQVDVIVEKATK